MITSRDSSMSVMGRAIFACPAVYFPQFSFGGSPLSLSIHGWVRLISDLSPKRGIWTSPGQWEYSISCCCSACNPSENICNPPSEVVISYLWRHQKKKGQSFILDYGDMYQPRTWRQILTRYFLCYDLAIVCPWWYRWANQSHISFRVSNYLQRKESWFQTSCL